jgi:type IV secretion system protein VirB10
MNFFQWRRENVKPVAQVGDEAQSAVSDRSEALSEVANARTTDEPILGDRGIPSINRVRSVQSRLTSVLAIGLMSVLGLGLLGWYYQRMLAKPSQARESAQAQVKRHSQAEMPLPRLPHISPPHVEPLSAEASGPLDAMLGAPPELPPERPDAWDESNASRSASSAMKSPAQLARERQLAGPVFTARGYVESARQAGRATHIYGAEGPADGTPLQAQGTSGANEASRLGDLQAALQPEETKAVSAEVLPTQRLLLPKGAFLDCTLETAIDSTLPGMTTCVMASDSFSADGAVVLLERGTKLVGETRGSVRQGAARVFVVWTQARTPEGVVIALDSPGTDELGRSGLPGEVDRHFWERFGAAILVSVIDGTVQATVRSATDGGAVIVNPSSTETVMTEVLKSTINIPPTVVKHNGDRIQVLVARDLDFRSVYELKASGG